LAPALDSPGFVEPPIDFGGPFDDDDSGDDDEEDLQGNGGEG